MVAAALLGLASCSSAGDGDATAGPDPSTALEADAEEGDGQLVDEEGEPIGTTLPENAVIIGSVLAETGLMEPLDRPALQAARIQVDRINAAGGLLGRPVVLRQIDSSSQLNETFQAANELIDRGAFALLVTCDVEFALPALGLAIEEGLPVISPCGGDPRWGDPGQVGPTAFSLATPLDDEGAMMADRAIAEWGTTAIVVVDVTNPDAVAQCDGFVERFRSRGGSISRRVEVDLRQLALDAQEALLPEEDEDAEDAGLATLFQSVPRSPAAVAMCSAPRVGQDLLLFLRRAGVQAPVIAGSTMDGDSWIVNVEDVGAFEMLSYASVFGDDPSQAVRELFDAYQQAVGARAGQGRPVTGADAIQALATAVERAGSFESAAIVDELEAFDAVELVGGTVTFSSTSHISSRSMRVLEIVDEQPRFVTVVDPPG